MATTIEAAKRRLDIAHLRRQRAQGAWLRGARGDVSGRASGERERDEARREYAAAEVALAARREYEAAAIALAVTLAADRAGRRS